jgi:hypothetical protein
LGFELFLFGEALFDRLDLLCNLLAFALEAAEFELELVGSLVQIEQFAVLFLLESLDLGFKGFSLPSNSSRSASSSSRRASRSSISASIF